MIVQILPLNGEDAQVELSPSLKRHLHAKQAIILHNTKFAGIFISHAPRQQHSVNTAPLRIGPRITSSQFD